MTHGKLRGRSDVLDRDLDFLPGLRVERGDVVAHFVVGLDLNFLRWCLRRAGATGEGGENGAASERDK